MSDDARSAQADRVLDELLDAATGAADDEAPRRADFASVLARAHRIDPNAMPARPAAPAIDRGHASADAIDRTLGSLVAAAREDADRDAAAARDRPRALPAPAPRSTRIAIAAATVLATAAALVLVFGATEIGELARRDAPDDAKTQSAAHVGEDEELRAAQESGGPEATPSRARPRPVVDSEEPTVPDEAAPLEVVPPPTVAPPVPPPLPDRASPAGPAKVRVDAGDALRLLDERAQRELAAGDRAAARATLQEIVRRAGRTSVAQLAYGDLFTLAHASGDAGQQRALWRAYVRKFPRGRFADDARAGLCRHASPGDRDACWQAYLRDFPRGAYRDQAGLYHEGDSG